MGAFFDRLDHDFHYALRQLSRDRSFSSVAILSIALGIGANAAIFSLVNALMLHLLPVKEPKQLVEFLNRYPGKPRTNSFSLASYEHYRDNNHVFSGLTGNEAASFQVRENGLQAQAVVGEFVVGNYFSVLGLRPAKGRLLLPRDDQANGAGSPAVVVSWQYWRHRSVFDQDVVGKQILVNGLPCTIVGVTPREFAGLQVAARSPICGLPWLLSR